MVIEYRCCGLDAQFIACAAAMLLSSVLSSLGAAVLLLPATAS